MLCFIPVDPPLYIVMLWILHIPLAPVLCVTLRSIAQHGCRRYKNKSTTQLEHVPHKNKSTTQLEHVPHKNKSTTQLEHVPHKGRGIKPLEARKGNMLETGMNLDCIQVFIIHPYQLNTSVLWVLRSGGLMPLYLSSFQTCMFVDMRVCVCITYFSNAP